MGFRLSDLLVQLELHALLSRAMPFWGGWHLRSWRFCKEDSTQSWLVAVEIWASLSGARLKKAVVSLVLANDLRTLSK